MASDETRDGAGPRRRPATMSGRPCRVAWILALALPSLAASAAPPCERNSKMTYWESSSLAPEFRHGILLGASESEFLRFARKADAAKEIGFFQEKDWKGPGAPIYIV